MKDRLAPRVAVIGLNWLGDAVMAMPALQRVQRMRPDWHLSIITKPPLAVLWGMHESVASVQTAADDRAAIRCLRQGYYERVYVMPRSFRSAWWAFRGQVPERVGFAGRGRRFLLTDLVPMRRPGDPPHQAHEMLNLFGLEALEGEILTPQLQAPEEAVVEAARLLPEGDDGSVWIGLIPGAARGPSKRWPAAHFVALAERLRGQPFRFVLFGGPGDRAACAEVAAGMPGVLDLSGQTSLPVFTACLTRCEAVVANDSGGMHLAVAAGTRVVGLFGLTDPETTGPLGTRSTVLKGPGPASRKIPRESAEAVASLAAIEPASVEIALLGLLNRDRC